MQEKKTRRKKVREKATPARDASASRLREPRQGSDNAWKEYRVVAHYDETQSHCHVSVTRGNHEVTGRLMARDAKIHRPAGCRRTDCQRRRRDLDTFAVGVAWNRWSISAWTSITFRNTYTTHVVTLFAEDDADGRACLGSRQMLHQLKHEGYSKRLGTRPSQCRAKASKSKRVALDRLLGYMSGRREMIRYPEFLARGWQIGSGPIEAQCKTTTARVKGSGKRWDGPNAEAVMALACLENSRLWQDYWLSADPAANY